MKKAPAPGALGFSTHFPAPGKTTVEQGRQVFWLPDHPNSRAFPPFGSGSCGFRTRSQRRPRDGFAPSSLLPVRGTCLALLQRAMALLLRGDGVQLRAPPYARRHVIPYPYLVKHERGAGLYAAELLNYCSEPILLANFERRDLFLSAVRFLMTPFLAARSMTEIALGRTVATSSALEALRTFFFIVLTSDITARFRFRLFASWRRLLACDL